MRKSLFVALLVCIILSFTALSQRSTSTPVTTTLRDYVDVTDPNTGSMQRLLMQIQSDGNGVYRNSSTLTSVILSSGSWDFNTGYNIKKTSTRQVFLDFSQPLAGTGINGGDPVPPFVTHLVQPDFNSKCYYNGYNMFTLAAGQTVYCGLTGDFTYNRVHYRIIMNPGCPAFSDGCTETSPTSVTCSGVDGNGNCNSWKIEPSGECVTADCAVRKNVIRLARIETGSEVATNLGDFYMSFSINVTNP